MSLLAPSSISTEELSPQSVVKLSDIDAERAALSSMLFSREALDQGIDHLQAQDFTLSAHQYVFTAISHLLLSNPTLQHIDRIAIKNQMAMDGTYQPAGGMDFLVSLTTYLPVAEDMPAYIKILKDASVRRQLLAAIRQINKQIHAPEVPANDLIQQTEELIFDIGESYLATKNANNDISHQIVQSLEETDELLSSNRGLLGLSTGFPDLDRKSSGLIPSEFIVLAGRPSMGKTALALNIILNILANRQRVLLYSFEMSYKSLIRRLVAIQNDIPLQDFVVRTSQDNYLAHLISGHDSFTSIANNNLIIYDDNDLDVTQIAIHAQRFQRQPGGLQLLVIDYLGLIKPFHDTIRENQAVKIGAISRSLKIISRTLNIPILCLAQLNRAPTGVDRKSSGFRPILSDLRDSGSIEQDADQVWMIHRPGFYEPDNTNLKHEAEVLILKNRNGPTGTVNLVWFDHTNRFRSADTRDYGTRKRADLD